MFTPKDSWKKKPSWESFFPMWKTTKPQNARENCKLKTQMNDPRFEATKGDNGFCLFTKFKPWWMKMMITGWVITTKKPVLYSLGSQAGVVVFNRSPWVGASTIPSLVGFAPLHRSRQSYVFITNFRAQNHKGGTFIQSNGFSMTLIDLSLVCCRHLVSLLRDQGQLNTLILYYLNCIIWNVLLFHVD